MNRFLKPKRFYQETLALMLPIILQNLITHLVPLCDTFMVGKLGETELAAMTSAQVPFFILSLMCFGIQSGASVLVSQYHGKRDFQSINRVMGIGFAVAFVFTLIPALFVFAFPKPVMGLLTNNMDLIPYGVEYAKAVCFSYVFSGVNGIYLAVNRSIGNTKLGAFVLTASGAVNIFFNWVLIFGNLGAPKMGVAGAAIATLICRVFESGILLIYAPRNKHLPIDKKNMLHPGKEITKDFMRFALPVIFNELLWSLSSSLYAIILGHMENSTPILAAYTLAGNVERVLAVGIFASGSAAAIITGREIGMKKPDVYDTALALNGVALAFGLLNMVLLLFVRFFAAEHILYPIMGLSNDASQIASTMFLMLALIVPIRSVSMVNIVGTLRGGGDVRFSLYLDVLPMVLFSIPMAALCGLVFKTGIVLVYLCMVSDELIKIVFAIRRLVSKKWINDVTRDLA